MGLELHPVLPLVAGALLSPMLPPALRRVVALAAPAAAVAMLARLPVGYQASIDLLGHTWVLLRVDALARVFALAFAGYGFIAGVYGWTENGRLARMAGLGLVAGGVGVTMAGDFWTLLLFWEWLTVCSLLTIWNRRSAVSLAAGTRYVLFHIAGGMCLMGGILLLAGTGHPLTLEALRLGGPASWLVLIGVAANAALPPLHAWLPDAYPTASPAGSVFLSAFTTKAAVYVLARLFPGTDLLVWAGAAMALYGVVFAVLANDIRRLLAYHIISQVGYMVCGVGLGTALALNGTAAHAFSHIFYKGLLMMSAGAVIHATGRNKLSDLGGLAPAMKATLAFMMIGAFSISGFPLFNGFVSKSMVVSAAAYSRIGPVELMLVVASMGTFLHTGLKLPWFTFFGRPSGARVDRPVPTSMYVGMALASAVCIGTGIAPGLLYGLLPHPVDYHPYTGDHVVQAYQLLIGTALGFWILRAKLAGEPLAIRDVDRVYRAGLPRLADAASGAVEAAGRVVGSAADWVLAAAPRAAERYREAVRITPLSSHVAVLGVAFVMLVFLVLYSNG